MAFPILLLCLFLTVLFWRYTAYNTAREARRKFQDAVDASHQLIKSRLDLCLNALYGYQGLFAASQTVTRQEFAAYSKGIDLRQNYPGLSSVSFVERVPADRKAEFLQRVRTDTSVNPEGFGQFSIYPVGSREEYWVVNYIEPFQGHEEAHGFDFSTEPVRRAALEKAWQTGKPTATGRISLLTGTGNRAGFLVFLPVFPPESPDLPLEERRQQLKGFIVGEFHVLELFRELSSRPHFAPRVDFEIFDGQGLTDQHLLYDHRKGQRTWVPDYRPRFSQQRTLAVADQQWRLSFAAMPGFGLTEAKEGLPILVLCAGIVFSFLLFGIVYSLSSSRIRSMSLAERMTREFKESEERYRLMAENSTDMISRHTPTGIYLYASPASKNLTAYEPQELTGHAMQEFIHPQDLPKVETVMSAASGEDVFTIRYRVRRKDGGMLWVETTCRRVRDPQTKAVREIIAVSRDISDRQKTEKELARLAAFPEENPNPVIELDEEGAISYLNQAAKSQFPKLLDQGLRHPILEGVVLAAAELEKGERRSLEREVQVGESVFEELISLVPESRSIRIYALDVTHRKRFERQRQEQARQLEKTNKELVHQQKIMQQLLADLQSSKSQLEASNKKLAELLSVKDEFVAKVSHELRTPLTAIKEGVRLLLDSALGPVNEEQVDFLKTIEESIDRLAELINNLLDLSKLQAGRLRLVRQKVSIQELIESTIRSYRMIAGSRRLTVECGVVPAVFADPNRILQVLGNLFSNAIKFTGERGNIVFSVDVRDGQVAVSVKDDGPGISEEDLKKLFQKFSQVGDAASQTRGTGLGLALCKELVELHGGSIGVTSELGTGTVFTFTLPIYTSEMALEKSFEQLVESAGRAENEVVALIVVDLAQFTGPLAAAKEWDPATCAQKVVDLARSHLKRNDVVMEIGSHSGVVLLSAQSAGIASVAQRLKKLLAEWLMSTASLKMLPDIRIGTAVYPEDGLDVMTLLAKANSALQAASGKHA
ncbi:MAG: CHASE domain-containing protein [Candidatus Omnitrophica bacterium]|nr:CHASE domain-containing protein [Candidatus Omnitrophota bacterium]